MSTVVRTMETIEDSVATMDRKVDEVAERMPQKLGTYALLKRITIRSLAHSSHYLYTVTDYGTFGEDMKLRYPITVP